jgi:hypothetical protein
MTVRARTRRFVKSAAENFVKRGFFRSSLTVCFAGRRASGKAGPDLTKTMGTYVCGFSYLSAILHLNRSFSGVSTKGAARKERRSMREWLYLLFPLAVVFYFVIQPQHLGMLVFWVRHFVSGAPDCAGQ